MVKSFIVEVLRLDHHSGYLSNQIIFDVDYFHSSSILKRLSDPELYSARLTQISHLSLPLQLIHLDKEIIKLYKNCENLKDFVISFTPVGLERFYDAERKTCIKLAEVFGNGYLCQTSDESRCLNWLVEKGYQHLPITPVDKFNIFHHRHIQKCERSHRYLKNETIRGFEYYQEQNLISNSIRLINFLEIVSSNQSIVNVYFSWFESVHLYCEKISEMVNDCQYEHNIRETFAKFLNKLCNASRSDRFYSLGSINKELKIVYDKNFTMLNFLKFINQFNTRGALFRVERLFIHSYDEDMIISPMDNQLYISDRHFTFMRELHELKHLFDWGSIQQLVYSWKPFELNYRKRCVINYPLDSANDKCQIVSLTVVKKIESLSEWPQRQMAGLYSFDYAKHSVYEHKVDNPEWMYFNDKVSIFDGADGGLTNLQPILGIETSMFQT